ncbi:hypothetical protein MCHK_09525 [Mesorhizobium huakuii 7653R]|nr:hypothetical protein MCHK_09525 [Mesorhizobium huakuii 7653R]
MGAIASMLIAKLWPYIAIGLAAAFGLWRAWRKGKADQKAAQDAERLAARTEADKIDQAVAGKTDAEVLKEQAKWSRPKS